MEKNDEKYQDSEEFKLELLNTFLESDLSYKTKIAKDYIKSELRKEKYENLAKEDEDFSAFLKTKYGSSNIFFELNEQFKKERLFNPLTDFDIEVEIITKEQYLKTNFISSSEIFLELLDGVATIQYLKKNGNASQLVGTLKKSFIPSSQYEVRDKTFSYFGGNRILMWDIIKQDWSSFYVPLVRRFIRDDTTDLQ